MCITRTPEGMAIMATPQKPAWCGYRDGVEVPGIGRVRLPDAEAQCRAVHGDRKTRWRRELAAAAGMSTKRFNLLSALDKAKIRWAFLMITAPSACVSEPDPIDWKGFAEAWRSGRVL